MICECEQCTSTLHNCYISCDHAALLSAAHQDINKNTIINLSEIEIQSWLFRQDLKETIQQLEKNSKIFDQLIAASYGESSLSFTYIWVPFIVFLAKATPVAKNTTEYVKIITTIFRNSSFWENLHINLDFHIFNPIFLISNLQIIHSMVKYIPKAYTSSKIKLFMLTFNNYLSQVRETISCSTMLNLIDQIVSNLNDLRDEDYESDEAEMEEGEIEEEEEEFHYPKIPLFAEGTPNFTKDYFEASLIKGISKMLFNRKPIPIVGSFTGMYNPDEDSEYITANLYLQNIRLAKRKALSFDFVYRKKVHLGNGIVEASTTASKVTRPTKDTIVRKNSEFHSTPFSLIHWSASSGEIYYVPYFQLQKYYYKNPEYPSINEFSFELLLVETTDGGQEEATYGQFKSKIIHHFSFACSSKLQYNNLLQRFISSFDLVEWKSLIYLNPDSCLLEDYRTYLSKTYNPAIFNLIPWRILYYLEFLLENGFLPLLWVKRIFNLFLFLQRHKRKEILGKLLAEFTHNPFSAFAEISEEEWEHFIKENQLEYAEIFRVRYVDLLLYFYSDNSVQDQEPNYVWKLLYKSLKSSWLPSPLLENDVEVSLSRSYSECLPTVLDYAKLLVSENQTEEIDDFRYHQQSKEHYVEILSITVSPTCVLKRLPTYELSNRILRHFANHTDRFIRVTFITEFGIGYKTQTNEFPNTFISIAMNNGVNIAGRRFEYFTYSNSQLTKGKCWFFTPFYLEDSHRLLGKVVYPKHPSFQDPNFVDSNVLHSWIGRIDDLSAGKAGKYMALLLSPTFPIVQLTQNQFSIIPDISVRGFCERDHLYSDGAGKMSMDVAVLVQHKLKLHSIPSAIQIRFLGCKGVLTLDPELVGTQIHLRQSMVKLEGCSGEPILEVIKTSHFMPFNLTENILYLLLCLNLSLTLVEKKISQFFKGIYSATYFKENFVSSIFGNFLHHLPEKNKKNEKIVNFVEVTLKNHYIKNKFKIPLEMAGQFIGVIDYTNTLKEGEIFLRIQKHDEDEIVTLTGDAIILRDPHPLPNDVRPVKLVDCPSLSHITNCVVFPCAGLAPLPIQCSGGDLDGDKYCVIWDPDFLAPPLSFLPISEIYFRPFTRNLDRSDMLFQKKHFESCFVTKIYSLQEFGNAINYHVKGNLLPAAKMYCENFISKLDSIQSGNFGPTSLTTYDVSKHTHFDEQVNLLWKIGKQKQEERESGKTYKHDNITFQLTISPLFNKLYDDWQNALITIASNAKITAIQLFCSVDRNMVDIMTEFVEASKKLVIISVVSSGTVTTDLLERISRNTTDSLFHALYFHIVFEPAIINNGLLN